MATAAGLAAGRGLDAIESFVVDPLHQLGAAERAAQLTANRAELEAMSDEQKVDCLAEVTIRPPPSPPHTPTHPHPHPPTPQQRCGVGGRPHPHAH
jgi:hypothetical protein